MKKLNLLGVCAAALLLATSCQDEKGLGHNRGDEAVVSFNIGTPQIATRAFSDGTTATQLQYAVYDEKGNILDELTVTDGTINLSTTVNLKLTTGNTYTVVFWAAEKNAPYTVDFQNKTMTVDYDAAKTIANDEKRDAFLNDTTFTVEGNMDMDVHLRRPFAQLNIGTSDHASSISAGYEVTQTAVEVNAYTTLNILTGEVSNQQIVKYNFADIPADTETFPVSGYKHISMNYILVDADKETNDVKFHYTNGTKDKVRTFGSVPLQRNYRTNIYGQLLTSNVDINVIVIPDYKDDHEKQY